MSLCIAIFLIFILFNNIFLNIVSLPKFINYWDELFLILLIIFSVYVYFKKHIKFDKRSKKLLILMSCIVLIGLVGNALFLSAYSLESIFRDIINFLKFPLTFLLLNYLRIDELCYRNISENYIKLLKITIIVIALFGVSSLFVDLGMSQGEIRHGIHPYQFIFTHPTYLVLNNVMILALLESYGFDKREILPYECLILLNVFLTMRTKGIMIVVVYLFIKYFSKYFEKYKKIYFLIIILLAVVVGASKVLLYLSWETSPREVLYSGALLLAIKCFPFGSGFATFASHLSWKYRSDIYKYIEIPFYYENGELQTAVMGDVGFPFYISQFGFIGFILCSLLFVAIYLKSIYKAKRKVGIQLLFIYILIGLTSESILMNSGVELAVVLSLCSLLSKKENILCSNSMMKNTD